MKAREILVAVVVAATTAAILATVFSRQQQNARVAAASRNLQQWGIALNLYLMDNRSQLPGVGGTPVTEEQSEAWYNALPPYLSRPALASLPPGERPRPGVPSLFISPASKAARIWDPEVFYFNYAMNRYLQPEGWDRGFKIFEMGHPANIIFLGETSGYTPALEPADIATAWGGRRPDRQQGFVLFCDGHVRLVSRSELLDPESLRAAAADSGGVSWFKE